MPRIDEQAGEINIKVVYHGPGLAGRKTNLMYIYHKTRPELKGKMISICGETDQQLFCDIVPMTIAPIRGLRLRVHLYTSAGSRVIKGARERVLHGVDGVVFVADSRKSRFDADCESMEVLATYIARQGRELASLPLVLQYNKRDSPASERTSIAELDAALNPGGRRPTFEAVAVHGIGVFDTVKGIVKQIVETLRGDPGAPPASNGAT